MVTFLLYYCGIFDSKPIVVVIGERCKIFYINHIVEFKWGLRISFNTKVPISCIVLNESIFSKISTCGVFECFLLYYQNLYVVHK